MPDSREPSAQDINISQFASRLDELIHNQQTPLQNLFKTEVIADGGNRSIRMHILLSDGNDRPQVKTLVKSLSATVLDYCIPRKQIDSAFEYREKTNSTSRIASLYMTATKLFTDISNSGEGGELLLFVLAENVLSYPQALSKMPLKTSARMHFHGLDGVYISCKNNGGSLRLHFGESKLHKSADSAIREAVDSISEMLNDEGFIGPAERDFYLLNTHVDLGSHELEDALRGFLDPADKRFLAPEICAVLLAGHELSKYPIVKQGTDIPSDVLSDARNLVNILEKRATAKNISKFHIDLFLVPFPNIQEFRDTLIAELGLR